MSQILKVIAVVLALCVLTSCALPAKKKRFTGRSWSPSGKRSGELSASEWNLLGKALEEYEGHQNLIKRSKDLSDDEWNLLGSVLDQFEANDKGDGKDFMVYWDKALKDQKAH